ncbi:TetR/AcrR family transcriptional regulator [Actinomadura sp. ATCC 31491]|uniref:TetR/AcrR family transcriptional regulator n=1 Tax=Actinomadura luzonensis TaxID=2805427 RepID=A0ABT0G7E2_9ACTN|nr:TetR/AcrR family transcriptional regulator [Actinomadura luzonensis]MCK2220308.1 TetR/AcrR family transcriptional regulator [Actinomadura luzonensis]
MDGKTQGLRADARRNRDLILAAAQELFLEQGVDVALEEVARRAGVGIGTLYRRFPDREALLRGVGEAGLRRMAELAEAARREEPDAWHALCRFLRCCTELRLGELSAKLDPVLHQRMRAGEEQHELRERVTEGLLGMIAEAQADGALRADVGPVDLALIMTLHVYAPPGLPGGQGLPRVVEIVLDGLRADRATPLPGPRSTSADLRRYTAVEPGAR